MVSVSGGLVVFFSALKINLFRLSLLSFGSFANRLRLTRLKKIKNKAQKCFNPYQSIS
jgi:hypothetical protein